MLIFSSKLSWTALYQKIRQILKVTFNEAYKKDINTTNNVYKRKEKSSKKEKKIYCCYGYLLIWVNWKPAPYPQKTLICEKACLVIKFLCHVISFQPASVFSWQESLWIVFDQSPLSPSEWEFLDTCTIAVQQVYCNRFSNNKIGDASLWNSNIGKSTSDK